MAGLATELLFEINLVLEPVRWWDPPQWGPPDPFHQGRKLRGPEAGARSFPGVRTGSCCDRTISDARRPIHPPYRRRPPDLRRLAGIFVIAPETFHRIAAGEEVDPAEYYFRTTPLFETAAEKYDWLNRVVAVSTRG